MQRKSKKAAKRESPPGKDNSDGPKTANLGFKYAQLPAPPEDQFADGPANIIAGRNVIKLDFYRVIGMDAEENTEIRMLSQRLVMPQAAIPELLKLLHEFGQALQQAAQTMAERSAADTEA